MDQFRSLLPEEKPVQCLDDLRNLTVKELKAILAIYKERMSGSKADLYPAGLCNFLPLETAG